MNNQENKELIAYYAEKIGSYSYQLTQPEQEYPTYSELMDKIEIQLSKIKYIYKNEFNNN